MFRMREHVDGLEGGDAVLLGGELGQVAGEGFGVATDVDDAPRPHFAQRRDALRRAALARGIQKHDVGVQVGRGVLHPLGRVGADKADVVDLIVPRIADGVLDGAGGALDAQHRLGVGRGAKADGADAAVDIQHLLLPGQPRQRNGLLVEPLGLQGVDLVKAAGADSKPQPAEGVRDIAGAVQHLDVLPQHHAGLAGVVVLHHRRHPGGQAAQLRHKVAAAGQLDLRRDQHHHDLAARFAAAGQQVAHKAGARILVIGGPVAVCGGAARRVDGLVEDLLLQKTVDGGQHAVAARGVDAAHQLIFEGSKGRHRLIAVVVGLRHAQNGLHRRELAQQRRHARLLLGQLRRIGGAQQRTAAAALGIQRAGRSFGCRHKFGLSGRAFAKRLPRMI